MGTSAESVMQNSRARGHVSGGSYHARLFHFRSRLARLPFPFYKQLKLLVRWRFHDALPASQNIFMYLEVIVRKLKSPLPRWIRGTHVRHQSLHGI